MDDDNTRPHFFDIITGGPGEGKTALLLHLSRLYAEAGWNVVYLSLADDRVPNDANVDKKHKIYEAEDFNDALEEAKRHPDSLMAIDEFGNFAPAGMKIDDRIVALARMRRHLRISLLVVSQDPWDLSVTVRKLYNRIYFFRLSTEGQQWLHREGVPEEYLEPEENHYNVFDKSRQTVEEKPFIIDEGDWL